MNGTSGTRDGRLAAAVLLLAALTLAAGLVLLHPLLGGILLPVLGAAVCAAPVRLGRRPVQGVRALEAATAVAGRAVAPLRQGRIQQDVP